MIDAISTQSPATAQTLQRPQAEPTQQTQQAQQAQRSEQESRTENNKEVQEESTKVTLGQQGAPVGVSPSQSPAQMYASVFSL